MSVDRCVHCGEIVPEDRMACWNCEHGITKAGSVLQSHKEKINNEE